MRKLALAYEELDAPERAEIDAYLAEHPELAEELGHLRTLEESLLPAAEESPELSQEGLGPEEEAAERRSLERLRGEIQARRSVEQARAQRATQAPARRLGELRRWIPLAAAAVLVLYFAGPWSTAFDPPPLELDGLRVLGVSPSGEVQRSAGRAFLTGDAFALAFTANRDAFVVVYHLGPTGKLSLADPADPGRGPRAISGAQSVQIPAADEEGWEFSGEPGTETFIVASAAEVFDLADVDAELRSELQALTNRRSRRLRLEQILRARLGTTATIDVEHLD